MRGEFIMLHSTQVERILINAGYRVEVYGAEEGKQYFKVDGFGDRSTYPFELAEKLAAYLKKNR
jgi:hypothetical protein